MNGKQFGAFQVSIAGEWSLHEFYQYSNTFEQLYNLAAHLDRLESGQAGTEVWEVEGEERALGAFPWRGGYSAYNFYRRIRTLTPKRYQPRVLTIDYHSPGLMELAVYLPAALAVSWMVTAFLKNARQLMELVRDTYRMLHEWKLMDIEAQHKQLELTEEQLRFLRRRSELFERELRIPHGEVIDSFTPNQLARLKVILSIFRRVKALANFEEEGRAVLERGRPGDLEGRNVDESEPAVDGD